MKIRSGFLLATVLVFAPRAARADAEEDARSTARALAQSGDEAFAGGRCDKAIPLWQGADRAFHAPTIELRIARCQALLGRVVDASETLQAIASATLAPDANPAFVAAQEQAKAELPQVRARQATLEIVLNLSAPVTELSLDDAPLAPEKRVFPVDPGRHRLRIRSGGAMMDRPLEFAEGEKKTLAASTAFDPPPPAPHDLRTVGFILGGLGGAALLTGTILGISAVNVARPLHDACGAGRNLCPPDEQDRISKVKTQSLLTDVFLGGGAVLLGAGAFFVVRDARKEAAPMIPRIVVAGTSVAVSGRF